MLWGLLLFSPLCSGRKGRFFFPTSDSNLSLPQPGVTGGYETYDHASAHFTWVYSNITNIYEKVQVNRKTIGGKCSRTRCDKTLSKVKKVKADLEMLKAATNMTMLEEVVAIVQNSSVADLLLQLQKSLVSQNEQIIALQTELESKSSQISSLSSSVADLETSLASQTSEVESHASLLESQSSQLEEIESKLTDLDSSVRLDIYKLRQLKLAFQNFPWLRYPMDNTNVLILASASCKHLVFLTSSTQQAQLKSHMFQHICS